LKYDSVLHYPEEASLALQLTIHPLPEELAFEDNNIYQPLETEFNYPLAFLVLGILVVLALVLILVFGKKIRKMWETWMEKRKYRRFQRRWENAEQSFAKQPDMAHADELLGLWKTYMEHLKNKPFREWTTSEISDFLENKAIINDFREIEMIIYAGRDGKNIGEACKNLKEVCRNSYQQKLVAQDETK
jgi:Sec-independent protein translocase protein TatA